MRHKSRNLSQSTGQERCFWQVSVMASFYFIVRKVQSERGSIFCMDHTQNPSVVVAVVVQSSQRRKDPRAAYNLEFKSHASRSVSFLSLMPLFANLSVSLPRTLLGIRAFYINILYYTADQVYEGAPAAASQPQGLGPSGLLLCSLVA